jgi:hypothetical protein
LLDLEIDTVERGEITEAFHETRGPNGDISHPAMVSHRRRQRGPVELVD